MRKEKPAETAEAYLIAEDKRICEDLMRIYDLLKETFCGPRLSRSHCNALERTARYAYEKAESEAELFWGFYDVRAVRNIKRQEWKGYVGSFDVWYMYHGFHFGYGWE